MPDLGYSHTPFLAALSVTHDALAPRVFTHLEQRAARMSPDAFAVELLPGLALSRVDVTANLATLSFPSGKQQKLPIKCETRLDYAEPQTSLRLVSFELELEAEGPTGRVTRE
jgi:hypothetical protein